ncbi:hypothetical protein [Methanovulcanius yangii]|nr:hypothetical protein [Methanovulcanius yangii]
MLWQDLLRICHSWIERRKNVPAHYRLRRLLVQRREYFDPATSIA